LRSSPNIQILPNKIYLGSFELGPLPVADPGFHIGGGTKITFFGKKKLKRKKKKKKDHQKDHQNSVKTLHLSK